MGSAGLLVHLAILRGLIHRIPEAGLGRLEILASDGAMAVDFTLKRP